MKPIELFAGALLALLFVGSASAGPCTDEIAILSKSLSTKDAGSGPTPGAQGPVSQHQQVRQINIHRRA